MTTLTGYLKNGGGGGAGKSIKVRASKSKAGCHSATSSPLSSPAIVGSPSLAAASGMALVGTSPKKGATGGSFHAINSLCDQDRQEFKGQCVRVNQVYIYTSLA